MFQPTINVMYIIHTPQQMLSFSSTSRKRNLRTNGWLARWETSIFHMVAFKKLELFYRILREKNAIRKVKKTKQKWPEPSHHIMGKITY